MQEGIFRLILLTRIPIEQYQNLQYQNLSEYATVNNCTVSTFEYRINHYEADKQLTNSLNIERINI